MQYKHSHPSFQPTSLKSTYRPFNIKMVGSKVFMTSNKITYTHFFSSYF